MKQDYPGMSEENETFVKEVLRPKGRVTVFYPEEVQLLLEELRGRLLLKPKFPFLAQPGTDMSKSRYPNHCFSLTQKLEVIEGGIVLPQLCDICMYYLCYQERDGKQLHALISRVPGAEDDTNPSWPFTSDKPLEPWQEEIRDTYKKADPERWPKG